MTLIPTILNIFAGICLYVGLLHLLIASGRLKPSLHLSFGLTCLVVFSYILALIAKYKAMNVDDYINARKLVSALGYIDGILTIWFVALHTKVKPIRLLLALNSLYLICLLINQVSPTGILYSHISRLSSISLPWGEPITHPEGTLNPLFGFQLLALISNVVFVFYACYRQYQRGEKQAALILGLSLAIFVGSVQYRSPNRFGSVQISIPWRIWISVLRGNYELTPSQRLDASGEATRTIDRKRTATEDGCGSGAKSPRT